MNDLILLKNTYMYILIGCLDINHKEPIFKWPKYCNIFINDIRLEWGKDEYLSQETADPFIFYFSEIGEEMVNENKYHLLKFEDYLFIDELNYIEIKSSYNDKTNTDSVYTLAIWLCSPMDDDIVDSDTIIMNNNIMNDNEKDMCICQGENEEDDDVEKDVDVIIEDNKKVLVKMNKHQMKKRVCKLCKQILKK
jgi:hypothetical protein